MPTKSLMVTIVYLSLLAPAWAADAPPTKSASAEPVNVDQALSKFRNEMQSVRADLVAKGLTLSADQAAKFWPLFEQYQKEQNEIIDGQIKAVKQYADSYDKMDDKEVQSLAERWFKLQKDRIDLRRDYFKKISKAVSPKTAARFVQVEDRIDMLLNLQLAANIPMLKK